MRFGNICERVERFPVGAIATFLGAATLSNSYALLNFVFIRHIFMIVGSLVVLLYSMKIALHRETFKKESSAPVPVSIFCTLFMIIMLLGSYILPYSFLIGKTIWLLGIILHTLMIIHFSYNHLIKKFDMKFFVPTWFIVYNGVMVAAVVGGPMKEPFLVKLITYYGIAVFFIILPFMIKRVIANPLPVELMHTKAIFLAPVSMCIITYLNMTKEYNIPFIFLLYSILSVALIFILKNIPKFFTVSFSPTFGALTFPMAIGTLASFRMAAFLKNSNFSVLQDIIFNVAGIQLLITTVIIGFVIFNFSKKISCQCDCK